MSDATNMAQQRSFAVLSAFADVKKPMKAGEIQAALDCPRSSLALILKGLLDLGYLNHNRQARTYFPSPALQRLGEWIVPTLLSDPAIERLAAQLRNKVDETVLISVHSNAFMEVAAAETSTRMIAMQVPIGTRFSLWGTAVGSAYLMTLGDKEIASLHGEAAAGDGTLKALDDVIEQVNAGRRMGYTQAFGSANPDLGAVAVPLENAKELQTLVLSIGGPRERIRKNADYLAKNLMETAARIR